MNMVHWKIRPIWGKLYGAPSISSTRGQKTNVITDMDKLLLWINIETDKPNQKILCLSPNVLFQGHFPNIFQDIFHKLSMFIFHHMNCWMNNMID